MEDRIIEGVAMRVYEKHVNGAHGPSTAYSVLVNTGQGEEWFSFGFKKPNVVADQQIKFVAKQKGKFWNADGNTLESIKAEQASSPKVMAKAVGAADNRQRSIVLQSAYERAILLINGALVNGAIKLPTKVDAKFDTYVGLIDEHALRLAEMFINPPDDFTDDPAVPAEDVTEEDVFAPPGEGYSVV